MRYVFFTLLAMNVLTFAYYQFVHQPAQSKSLVEAQAQLVNPVTATNVSQELPPLIGTKK